MKTLACACAVAVSAAAFGQTTYLPQELWRLAADGSREAIDKTRTRDGRCSFDAARECWCWEVKGIAPGEYRLVCDRAESGDPSFSPLYVNGRLAAFDRSQSPYPDPKNAKASRSRVQTVPVALKSGDVIMVTGPVAGLGSLELAAEPLKDAWRIAFECCPSREQRLVSYGGTQLTNGCFSVRLRNDAGVVQQVTADLTVLDHWRKPVAHRTETFRFGGAASFELPFVPAGDTRTYRGYVNLSFADGARERRVFTSDDLPETAGFRKRLPLDRGWEVAWRKDDGTYDSWRFRGTPPDGIVWTRKDLPDSLRGWWPVPTVHQRWFRRPFVVPPANRGARYFIEIERQSARTRVYVNGKNCGENAIWEQDVPLKVEVTDALRPDGTNEIFIACQERTRAFPDDVLRTAKTIEGLAATEIDYGGGCWGVFGRVALLTEPARRLTSEPRIFTSVREKTIRVEAEAPSGTRLSHRVLWRGREVVPPFAETVRWEKPILWGPAPAADAAGEGTAFPLLELESTLKDAETGRTLDVLRTRFGFREFGSDGLLFLWNGKSVAGAGRAMTPRWGEDRGRNQPVTTQDLLNDIVLCKANGNFFRRHALPDRMQFAFADEEGLLISKTLGLRAVGVVTAANAKFWDAEKKRPTVWWENQRRNAEATVRAYPNSPSLYTWYISNECFFESSARNPKVPPEQNPARWIAPTIETLQRMDPTRFVETGCDMDCDGQTGIISTHYPLCQGNRTESQYLPDLFFWRAVGAPFAKGMMVPNGLSGDVANQSIQSPIRWGVKPISVHETGWDYFQGFPHANTRLWGEDAYNSAANITRLHCLFNYLYLQGERDAEPYNVVPWRGAEHDDTRKVCPAWEAFLVQRHHVLYASDAVAFDADFIHDVLADETITTYWRLVDAASGARLAGAETPRRADFCRLFRERIAFDAPAPGRYRLEYGIAGHVARTHGIVTSARPAQLPALPENVIPADRPLDAALLGRAEAGETFVILARDDYPDWLPVTLRLTERDASVNWTFRPHHPLLAGIPADELSYWSPDPRTGRRYFYKPATGAARTILEAGGPKGLCYSGLLEVPHGKGGFVFSRLDLDPARSPVALRLLKNLAVYRVPPVAGNGRLGVLFDQSSPVYIRLAQLGVAHERAAEQELDRYPALLVDGSRELSDKLRARLAKHPGRIFVREPSAAGWGVTLRPCTRKDYAGRAVKVRPHDAETEGLTNFDFFWRQMSKRDIASHLTDPSCADDQVGTAEIFGAEDLLYPRYLAKRGNLVFETVNWVACAPEAAEKAERVITTLFANAGVRVSEARPMTLPEGLTLDDVGAQPVRLASRYAPGGEETAMVPVGAKAEYLAWRHQSLFGLAEDAGTATVRFEDGGELVVRLGGQFNLRDLNHPSPERGFAGELDTVTRLAGTEVKGTLGTGAAYVTHWKNPFPNRRIASLRFKSLGLRAIEILNVYTGRVVVRTPDSLRKPGETEGEALARYQKEGDDAAARGDWKTALKAYETSLAVNPNQPTVVEREAAMKKKLGIRETVVPRVAPQGYIAITGIEFSTDGGKTWKTELPVVSVASPKFSVRVSFAGKDIRPLSNGGYIGHGLMATRDFASAIASESGFWRQGNNEKGQRSWRYLPHPPRPVVFDVDLGAREEGRLTPQKRKLKACAAWKPGNYRFVLDFSYWLEKPDPSVPGPQNRRVGTKESFMVVVTPDAAARSSAVRSRARRTTASSSSSVPRARISAASACG